MAVKCLGHFTFAVVELTFLLFIVLQSIDLYFGTSDEGKLVRSRALFGYAGFANEILYLRLVPVLLSLFFLHMPSLVTIEISLAIVFMTAVVPAISGAWDAYSVANITKYMNDIGLGFCEFFDDDDSNEVCANYYGLLFAWPLILIFGATIIVRSVQKSLPNLSSLLSLTLRLSLTLSLSLSLSSMSTPARARSTWKTATGKRSSTRMSSTRCRGNESGNFLSSKRSRSILFTPYFLLPSQKTS